MNSLLACTAAALLTGQAPDTRAKFEEAAAQLKFFPTHQFTFGRGHALELFDDGIHKSWTLTWVEALREITGGKHAAADLIELLKHKSPVVRTLAAAALFQRDDPKLLPHFASLLGDKEKTAPAAPLPSREAVAAVKLVAPPEPNKPKLHPPEDFPPQTVGAVAQDLLDFWLKEAGVTAKDFDAYWNVRKDRKFCASWFLVRMRRIQMSNHDFHGFDEKRTPEVRAIRADIDALPELDRDWTLLYVGIHGGLNAKLGAAFAKRPELFEAAKRLGPDRLLDLIYDRPVSDDPDLKAKDWNMSGRYDIAGWVIGNAVTLLRETDAPALLDVIDKTRHGSPGCVIAAAELQPANARKWLHDAFRRHPVEPAYWHQACNRAHLAAALWRLVGDSELDFIADWFYSEKVERNPHTTQTEVFLRDIQGIRAPADRKLVARLVDDPRLQNLDHQSLRALILTASAWTKAPIVSERELHPNWERGDWTPETPRDLEVVASWRERLKKSRAVWGD